MLGLFYRVAVKPGTWILGCFRSQSTIPHTDEALVALPEHANNIVPVRLLVVYYFALPSLLCTSTGNENHRRAKVPGTSTSTMKIKVVSLARALDFINCAIERISTSVLHMALLYMMQV